VRVVETVDVAADRSGCLFVGAVVIQVNFFGFETAKKTLHWSIVVAVTFAAHALPESTFGQTVLKCERCVLGAAITVDNQGRIRISKQDRLIQRLQDQPGVDHLAGGPADDSTRTEVLNRTQVCDSFHGVNVSDIG